MIITFPYGAKNQTVHQSWPMWTWATGAPQQQSSPQPQQQMFLLPNTEPQSPGPGIPRADLSHSINSALVNWYPLNHGNSIGAFDIGPHGLYLPRNTVEGLRTDGPRGQSTAYKSRRTGSTYSTTGYSSFGRTEDASEWPTFSTSANWTISCWIRIVNGSTFTIFREGGPGGYSVMGIGGWPLKKLTINTYFSGANFGASGSTELGTGWRHCVGVKIGTSGNLYLDGEIDTAGSSGVMKTHGFSGTDQVVRTACQVGSWPASYEGDFCNLRAWRRALDQSEIRELYRNPWVGLAGSPVTLEAKSIPAALATEVVLTTTKVVVTKPNFSPVGYHRLGSSAPRTRLGGYLFPQRQKTILPPAIAPDVVLVSSSTERVMGNGLGVPVGYHRLGASYPRTRSRDYLFSKRSKKVLYISGAEAVPLEAVTADSPDIWIHHARPF